jgi:hypothetical protein
MAGILPASKWGETALSSNKSMVRATTSSLLFLFFSYALLGTGNGSILKGAYE